MYSSVKQYLTDEYEYGESDVGDTYARVGKIDVWYSPKEDSCLASLEVKTMYYQYTIEEYYYNLGFTNKIINVSNGYITLYACDYMPGLNKDCRLDYISKISEYHS